jgi:nitrous oxide reductase accessory protein NosL
MKRSVLIFALVIILAMAGAAVAMKHGGMKGCHYCGMDLEKFAHTSMTINYDDGSKVDVCSLHCAAIDMSINIGKAPESIMVGDHDSKSKIDAEKAYWVLDDANPGVMSTRGKWAFKSQKAAAKYMQANCEGSCKVITFEDALKAAYEDMYADTQMIRKKRKMMKMKGGMKH